MAEIVDPDAPLRLEVAAEIAFPEGGITASGRRSSRGQEKAFAILPRGLMRSEAAALAGLSPSGFDKARRDGRYPDATLPGGRYDRKLIENAMDRASGLEDSGKPSEDDTWKDFGQQPVKR
jgi:hypothetical protein